jgi:formate dehydrogenase major subunit
VPTFYVDGAAQAFDDGISLLDALLAVEAAPIHICRHESLGPIGTCDTCLVERDGRLVRACLTPVHDGDRIDVSGARVQKARQEAVERLLERHRLACTVCDNNGNCALHDAVRTVDLRVQERPWRPSGYAEDGSHPFYSYRPDACILCGRCVEACQDVAVNETLSIDWELPRPRVVWDGGQPAGDSSCVACGQCVSVCPVDALIEKSMVGRAGFATGIAPALRQTLLDATRAVETDFRPLLALSDMEAAMRASRIKRTKTVCTYCGVGCSFEVWTHDREILKVEPNPQAPANGIATCIKGKFGWDFVNSPDRLARPLVREAGGFFREASWEEALERVRDGFTRILSREGADAVAVIGSSKCTNEEAYLTQKLARQVFGTNNVDNCSRYCQAPATAGLWRTVGYGGDAGSMADIEAADLVLIVGSNTAESHPVLASKIKRAQKLFGQRLVVADLRRHEMAERADLYLHPAPGTDLYWICALTRYLIDAGWADMAFIDQRTDGFAALRASLEPYTLGAAAEVTGIRPEELERLAVMLHEAPRVAVLWAMGVTQHQAGSDTSTALSNLLLVLGQYGRPGTGAFPLRGHNNVQGTSDFGCMPNYLPGYQPVGDPAVRARFEAVWGRLLPAEPGLDNHQMMDAIHAGRLQGVYLVGEDVSLVDADSAYVEAALSRLPFLVVQDVFFSKTARYADVVLPASPSLEKSGTFTNTERRIQRLDPAFAPLGESLPDWQILIRVARALGVAWDYADPADIMAEAAMLAPLFAGVQHERLDGFQSVQWPVAPDGTGTPYLYRERFHFDDGRARFWPVAYSPPAQADDEFDLYLNNGRLLEHFHQGQLTFRSEGIRARVPKTFVEVSPELAADRGLQSGDVVRLRSRHGAIRVSVEVTGRVQGRELYLPMHDAGEAAVNQLTGRLHDRATNTPAFKELPVALERLELREEPALPRRDHRRHQRTPRRGVDVERKWARGDYTLPGGEER